MVDSYMKSATKKREDAAAAGEVWHGRGVNASADQRQPGRDPDGNSYRSFASFSDPDGNRWLLQEITQRIPGRV